MGEVRREHADRGILGSASLVDEARTLSRALLMSARGNSGVIVSQIVAGISAVIVEEDLAEVDGPALARAVTRGAEPGPGQRRAPAGGHDPQRRRRAGRGGARGRRRWWRRGRGGSGRCGGGRGGVGAHARAGSRPSPKQEWSTPVAPGACSWSRRCTALTGSWTDESGSLQQATEDLLLPRSSWHSDGAAGSGSAQASRPRPGGDDRMDPLPVGIDGPAFEVMYLLEDSDADRVGRLTTALDGLGDSLLVVGGPALERPRPRRRRRCGHRGRARRRTAPPHQGHALRDPGGGPRAAAVRRRRLRRRPRHGGRPRGRRRVRRHERPRRTSLPQGACSRRSGPPVPPPWSSCPTTRTPSWRPRSPAAPPTRTGSSPRSSRRAPRSRAWPPSPSSTSTEACARTPSR